MVDDGLANESMIEGITICRLLIHVYAILLAQLVENVPSSIVGKDLVNSIDDNAPPVG